MERIHLFCDNALNCYDKWPSPTVIISDGPYGVNGFKGDLRGFDGLLDWYRPHIQKWTEKATEETTLWFWCTEIGWATVHPALVKNGWQYVCCNVWDKGLSHVAGNVNTKTIRHLPVVTEVCVQYVRPMKVKIADKYQSEITMQDWLRSEWERTGLPLSKANEACGVANVATRKYLTKDSLWYMPPPEMFEKLVQYANQYGNEEGKPYFSLDGIEPIKKNKWEKLRAKFYCPFGLTNVWHVPQLRSEERIKDGQKAVHMDQKPLEIIRNLITMSSDEGDVVWDPFGGLMTTAVACMDTGRICYSTEINSEVFQIGEKRVRKYEISDISAGSEGQG